jgi:hypothetical protein
MTTICWHWGDWLAEQEVSHVAMKSTEAYWHPIWNLPEDRFVLLLVNAHHIKQVPARKTDVVIVSGSEICSGMVCSRAALCPIECSASFGN